MSIGKEETGRKSLPVFVSLTLQKRNGENFPTKSLCCFSLSFSKHNPFPRISNTSGCLNSEREALIAFRRALIDPHNLLSSWDNVLGTDCCKWRGVSCDSKTGYVMKLDLHGNLIQSLVIGTYIDPASTLSGQIDPALLELKHIQFLDLSYNAFNCIPMPSFLGSMVRLRHLNLSFGGFAGRIPQQLGNLPNLVSMKLSSSTGYLSTESLLWLTNITTLEYLDMSSVSLSLATQDFVHLMNQLPSLIELRLSGCGLSYIPLSLSAVDFTSLRVLDLSSNNFHSSIPHWISNISSLVSLNLSSNNFHGQVPYQFSELPNLEELSLGCSCDNLTANWSEFLNGHWSKLKRLVLSFSSLEGGIPKSIGNITSLENLQSAFLYRINGSIPNTMSHLTNLKVLALDGYQTHDIIPDWLGELKNLSHLILSACSLKGSIPPSLGGLSSLQYLDLSTNSLTGSIPTSLGQLTSLTRLYLSRDSLTGKVPESLFENLRYLEVLSMDANSDLVFVPHPDWLPPFQLSKITLSSCHLGPSFPTWLQTQKHIWELDISNASTIDVMPTWFWRSTQQAMYLFLSDNKISGPIPHILNGAWMLDLSNNQFSGPFPEKFASAVHRLVFFRISGNQISGKIPSSIGEMVLLFFLDLSHNNIGGAIPSTLGNCLHLEALDIRNNNLSGVIPDSLGLLSGIHSIYLRHNRLSGTVPLTLRKCINLHTLDLGENNFSGSIPTWIGSSFPGLEILNVRSSSFSGSLPTQLWNLSSLQILDVASNLLSGSIPQNFENLIALKQKQMNRRIFFYNSYMDRLQLSVKRLMLEYDKTISLVAAIDLSNNNLSGEIPEGLTSLLGLRFLNLSGNHLTGRIPKDIGRMVLLESLDLSKNQLSGEIPEAISNLIYLSSFNLSYNKLWGEIPSGQQLQALPDPSIYIGNDGLCGFPLSKNCTAGEAPKAQGMDDNEAKYEMFGFYAALAPGFVTGFWVFCGTLLLKKAWRTAFYRLVDKVKDRIYVAIRLRMKFNRNASRG